MAGNGNSGGTGKSEDVLETLGSKTSKYHPGEEGKDQDEGGVRRREKESQERREIGMTMMASQ